MERYLFIGTSHLAMLKKAWDKNRGQYRLFEAKWIGMDGPAWRYLHARGRFSLDDAMPALRKLDRQDYANQVQRSAAALTDALNALSHYDCVVACDMFYKSSYDRLAGSRDRSFFYEGMPVSDSVLGEIDGICGKMTYNNGVFRQHPHDGASINALLGEIAERAKRGCQLYFMPEPLWPARAVAIQFDQAGREGEYAKLAQSVRWLQRSSVHELGWTFVAQPDSTVCASTGGTLDEYVRDKNVNHFDSHMNVAFGMLILSDILG